jgi:hypothetical protein
MRTSAHSLGQIPPSWECGIEFATGFDVAHPSSRSLTSGAVGTLTLSVIPEAAWRRLPCRGNTLYYSAIPTRDAATTVAEAIAAAVAANKMGYGRLPR